MSDAFISYRRTPSSGWAMLLESNLQSKYNLDIYVDVNRTDSNRVQFPERLKNAISKSSTFICLLAEGTLESSAVMDEVEYAYTLEKPCVPVFQEGFKRLMRHSEDSPEGKKFQAILQNPAVRYLLNFDAVHLMDEQNLFIHDAIEDIAHIINPALKKMPSAPKQHPERLPQPPKPVTDSDPHVSDDIQPSESILQPPFKWTCIPAGAVMIMGRKQTIPTFEIAKYPVTNAQYRQFYEEEGLEHFCIYPNPQPPLYWAHPPRKQKDAWLGDKYPVVGITWYEADAFCRWLSWRTGERIVLPDEIQWQRAARGDTQRLYPWGGTTFNRNYANTGLSSINCITPVDHYTGTYTSVFDVMDMTGNVCEWTSTSRAKGYVLRGGSWFEKQETRLHVTYAMDVRPAHDRRNDAGFRIARLTD